MKNDNEVYPWESKTTLIAALGVVGSILAAAGIVELTVEQTSALGLLLFSLVAYLRKRGPGKRVVLSKSVLLVMILVGVFAASPANAITPSISPAQQAYQDALWLNDHDMWKSATMLPLIEKATADTNFLPAFVLKAKVWNQLGNSSNAIQAAQHVTDRDPTNSTAWLEMGKAYSKRAWTQSSPWASGLNYMLAVSALTNATIADPQNEAAWFELGEVYTTLGNKTAAKDAYLEVLRIDPYDARASAAVRR